MVRLSVDTNLNINSFISWYLTDKCFGDTKLSKKDISKDIIKNKDKLLEDYLIDHYELELWNWSFLDKEFDKKKYLNGARKNKTSIYSVLRFRYKRLCRIYT